MSTLDFIGQGWQFPVRPDAERGELDLVGGADAIRRSIILILETEPGERVMRPGFGCGLRRYLMEPNTAATRASIQRDVERSLTRFEPRIELRSVAVEPGDDPALVLIRIDYAHAREHREDSLVFPLYLE